MADYKPPGVGEGRVSKVSWLRRLKNFLVNPTTFKTALKVLDIVQGLVKIVAKLLELMG